MDPLRLEAIQVGYPVERGIRVVVDDFSLALAPGEIGCLLGSSGCGKTTVLRAIAGFEPLLAGRILLGEAAVAAVGTQLPPERRNVGMMFQDYALFPHLDVAANVGFGLRALRRDARRVRVEELLALVGMRGAARSYPHELSGGQQQRIALARALAPSPGLLLLDEPFSNLDVDTRSRLVEEVRAILKASGISTLMVTHDQNEAFVMADRIGVMDRGRLLQWDSARQLYLRPADRFVAGFVGRGSLVSAAGLGLAGDMDVLLRPEQLRFDPAGPIRATLLGCGFRGPEFVCTLRLASGEPIQADLPADAVPPPGQEVRFSLLTEDLPAFAR